MAPAISLDWQAALPGSSPANSLRTSTKGRAPGTIIPGYVYNVVAQGTITVEDGCGEVKQYSAGQAFETSDGRVHRAYNLEQVDAVEYNMFVNLGASNATITKPIPNNERRCGPPSTVDECKGGGWEKFDWPNAFAGQGECVTYVNNRPTITLLVPADPLPQRSPSIAPVNAAGIGSRPG